jgi:hypothetical protein
LVNYFFNTTTATQRAISPSKLTVFHFKFPKKKDYSLGTSLNVSAGCVCGGCTILDFGNPVGDFQFSSIFNETNQLKIEINFKNRGRNFCVNRVELYLCSLPSFFIFLNFRKFQHF